MRAELNDAFEKARKAGHVYLLTKDSQGYPHMSMVQLLNIDDNNRLKIVAWLCPNTCENIDLNPRVTLVVWDSLTDTGYQILGDVADIQEIAELNGFVKGMGNKRHFTQIEWKIWIDAEKILNFQKAPHIEVEV